MPTVAPKSKILVTGGSGFIGAWVVRKAVERGYHVVAAVRTEAGGQHLKELYKDALSYTIVPDITKDGAYDSAVVGVSGIIHVASPVAWVIEDPWKDTINPAVQGTVGILKSAHQFGKDVKRVVITSSASAARSAVEEGTTTPPAVFRDTLWNEESPKTVEEKGKGVQAFDAYQASKALAEKAAWKFIETEKPAFDLTTILPAWVLGPYIHSVPSASSFGSTLTVFYNTLISPTPLPESELPSRRGDWLDVRDTALEHVLSLEVEEAGGKRLFGSNGSWTWQEFFDVVAKKNILLPDGSKSAVKPGGKVDKPDIHYDVEPVKKLFPDFPWTSFETTVGDLIESFAESGFLKRA